MPEVDPVGTASPLHRPLAHGKDHRIALSKGHHFHARLHPGPLFGHDEFAASEILAGSGEEYRHLKRKHLLAIDVLMEAVVVTRLVLEK